VRRTGLVGAAALALLAGCDPPSARPAPRPDTPAGTWAISAGPVADGDSSNLALVPTREGTRGLWLRQGDHPPVPLDSVREEGGDLLFIARMGAGPARMRLHPLGEERYAGEWTRDTVHLTFRAVRTSRGAPADLVATFALAPLAPGVLSRADSGESFPSPSPDGRELVFTRHRADWSGHRILFTRRTAQGWSAPQTLPFSGSFNDREPKLSPDGRHLVFSSNRPLRAGEPVRRDLDLWIADRLPGGGWSPARHLEGVNSEAHDFCPVLAADGTLYFVSTRADSGPRRPNIWRARRAGSGYAPPEMLPATLNSGLETNVYVTPDQRLMLLSRDGAADGLGGDDLYLSEWRDGTWTPARHLGVPISSYEYDYGPSLSADGRWLYFTSHRRGAADLYRVEARVLGIAAGR
jgi:Tol biopolymer transport system component